MEDRSIWLPAGLESPGLEPDDRASQRGEPAAGKRPDRAPVASGEQGPSNQDEAPKRGRSKPGSGEKADDSSPGDKSHDAPPAGKPRGSKPAGKPRASKPAGKPRASKPAGKPRDSEPAAKSWTSKQHPRPQVAPAADGNGNRKPRKSKPREQERDRHRPSQVDAMGQDKYREVVGKRYGLGRSRQFLYYGIFVAFVVAAYIGLKAAADSLDKAPAHDRDQAPWSKPGAPQGPLGGFEPTEPGDRSATDFQ